ncbi:hypothetical protein GCM10028774_52800 [Spirosoma jeollabukense]
MLFIEKKSQVQTFLIEAICPRCGVGQLRKKLGSVFTLNEDGDGSEGGIRHECTRHLCGYEAVLPGREPYPRTVTEYVTFEPM